MSAARAQAPRRSRAALPMLLALAALALGACKTQPLVPAGVAIEPEELQRLAGDRDWNSIAEARVDCDARADACAEAHATWADACLRLAIELPADALATRGRARRLLDNAEYGYRTALTLQPESEAPSRASYHGGLLLTLSERRNRLDASVRERRLARENQKLLRAAKTARSEVADDALGYVYGASALVFDALLSEPGPDRCRALRAAESMLERAPEPPPALLGEQRRLERLVARELRGNGCPAAAAGRKASALPARRGSASA